VTEAPRRAAPDLAGRRISLVLHKFSRGGSDRVAAYLARGFTDLGMDVDLLVFASGGEVEAALTEIIGRDIPIIYLRRAMGLRSLDLILGMSMAARALRARAPHAVISTANNTAWITAAALKLSGLRDCRLILKTTNPVARSRHRGLVRLFRRWGYRMVFRRAAAVWTLSAEESDDMRVEYPDFDPLFRHVANPYVTPAMLASPQPSATAHKGKAVISVARLTAQKRLDRLIAAFALVRDPDARLIILGEGEDRAALTAQVASLGLQERVTLPGYVRNVADALHQADLFVLTSDYEGLPAAVLEAMAANCPVLCTDCFPAARAIVGGSPGCAIIADTSPQALARMIDQHLATARPAGLRQVAERYSIANGIASHVAALSEIA
jgi:glycosyltransferase involved in cell wall biosynthesis